MKYEVQLATRHHLIDADTFKTTPAAPGSSGTLELLVGTRIVASYAPNAWLSIREVGDAPGAPAA